MIISKTPFRISFFGGGMTRGLDILFVNPGDRRQVYQGLADEFSAVEPPLFSGLFAAYACRKGLSTAILDMPAEGLSCEEAARHIEEDYDPALVAVPVYGFQPSASTQNMTSAGRLARLVKALNPRRRVLMTGTHPAALPERTLAEEAVDFVVDGKGPITIMKTFEALRAGTEDFSGVPSLWWRDGTGALRRPAAGIMEGCWGSLKAPVARVGFAPAPCPTARSLENRFYPNAETPVRTAERLLQVRPMDLSGRTFYSWTQKFKGPF